MKESREERANNFSFSKYVKKLVNNLIIVAGQEYFLRLSSKHDFES